MVSRKRSYTEHQQFKQGCILFGWGNWKDVERVVKTRTKVISKHIKKHHAEEKASLDRQHELHIQGVCVGLPAELITREMNGAEEEPMSNSGSMLRASSDKELVIEDEEEQSIIQSTPSVSTAEGLPDVKRGRGRPKKMITIEEKEETAKRGRGHSKKSKGLPQGVYETPAGGYQVVVYYQGSNRNIGRFKSLERATLANEIARNMLKKDKGLQLSAEECERNIKLAKEAALADVPDNDMVVRRGPYKKADSTTSVLAQPVNDHKVNDCRDLDGGVSTNGRKRKLSRKLADSIQLVAEKKQPIKSIQQSDLSAKKCQKETPKPIDEPGSESKTSAQKIPHGVCETPTGSWRVQVYYQGSNRSIGAFQTLESAILANEIARSMLKKDKGLQLSAEECQQNIKLAKEAASASCVKRDRGRPTKAKTNEKKDTAKRGRGRPKR